MVELFTDAGVDDVRRVPTDDGSDAVVGYSPGPEGAPTVLLYSHYDVQPADPAEWTSSPWELTERDGRLYGRGSADCKGNLVMLLTALRLAAAALAGRRTRRVRGLGGDVDRRAVAAGGRRSRTSSPPT